MNVGMPQFNVPPINISTGQWNKIWFLFLQDLWTRTGGTQDANVDDMQIEPPSNNAVADALRALVEQPAAGNIQQRQIEQLLRLVEQPSIAPSLLRQIDQLRAELSMLEDASALVRYVLTRYAPLLSPTFTGVPKVPTAAVDTNTTQAASTAFVLGQAATATPLVDGTGAAGTSTRFARGDHVHPTDTSRAPVNNPIFTGNVGVGTSPSFLLHAQADVPAADTWVASKNATAVGITGAGFIAIAGASTNFATFKARANGDTELFAGGSGALLLGTASTDRARIDNSGNFLAGATSGSNHRIFKSAAADAGNLILESANGTNPGFNIYSTSGALGNAANATIKSGKDGTTGRSYNASGSINAAGADYAEFMYKSPSCGIIKAGDICGVDVNGELTDILTGAVMFRIKSTNPSYVGGDTWAAGLTRPEPPAFEIPAYTGIGTPEPLADDATDEEKEVYAAPLAQYEADQAQYVQQVADAKSTFENETMPAYQTALADFEAKLEAARQKVDRIAFCGQVPANVFGAQPGDFILPDGGGTPWDLMNDPEVPEWFKKYVRSVGRVQNLLPDGRVNVVVKLT